MATPPSVQAIAPTAAAIPGIKTVPQHSIANNVFRKQKVVVDIYDAGNPDGDIVDVYLNNAFAARVTLQPLFLATNLLLTLKPSDTLATKTNVLKFVGINSGTDSFGAITIGLKGHDGQIFTDSAIAVNGGSDATVGVGGQAKANLALGLACIDPVAYLQSANHIQDAQKLGYARVVTVDRVNRTKRQANNVAYYKRLNPTAAAVCKANALTNPTHEACAIDEYPLAMFKENQDPLPGGGRPHMRAIPSRDNSASGAKIGAYAAPYKEANPASPIFAEHTPDNLEIIVPAPGGTLFCKNAF